MDFDSKEYGIVGQVLPTTNERQSIGTLKYMNELPITTLIPSQTFSSQETMLYSAAVLASLLFVFRLI